MDELLYDVLLYVSSAVHTPIKIFTMYIIYIHSPTNMEALPYFMLNIMAWNLVGTFFGSLLHLYPLFPDECFRANGLVAVLPRREVIGHVLYCLTAICAVNCATASTFVVPYRYVLFVHPTVLQNIRRHWFIAFFGFAHFCSSFFTAFFYVYFIVPVERYPFQQDIPSRQSVFCFEVSGMLKALSGTALASYIILDIVLVVTCALLLTRHLKKMVHVCSKQTLDLQRKFLQYLLILTSVPAAFGGIPLVIIVVTSYFPTLPHATEAYTVSLLVIYNHGTLLSVITILTFKPYRETVRKMFSAVINNVPNNSAVVHVLSSRVLHE
uniref:G protein-coupled receptor n=1 Tax=Steinernema glaseri TaxID=37863 RepID=A0A1I8AVU4_9BILA